MGPFFFGFDLNRSATHSVS